MASSRSSARRPSRSAPHRRRAHPPRTRRSSENPPPPRHSAQTLSTPQTPSADRSTSPQTTDVAAAPGLAELLTPSGQELLASLPPYDPDRSLALGEQLRTAGYGGDVVAAALTQQRLRARAEAKFGPFAQRMLFTHDGLEQSTRLCVSAHHAARYARTGVTRVADLGCGIGGDALALAGLDVPVLAVERDETTAALATVNMLPFAHAQVICADARNVDLEAEGIDAIFADPARRRHGCRVSDPELWSPPFSEVMQWRQRISALGVKVAPGLDHTCIPADAHAQWVSVDGDVVEAGLWFDALAPEGPGRSALILSSAPQSPTGYRARVLTDPACSDPSSPPEQVDSLSGEEEMCSWLFEPDGALIRAGLVSWVAQRTGARPLSTRLAYLTGEKPLPEDLQDCVRAWRIRDVLPLHLKALKARVRAHDIGRLEIHRRGVDVSPDALRASLKLRGQQGETWVLARLGTRGSKNSRGVVLVVETP